MRTWEFTDRASGEDFFVEAETKELAEEIANTFFKEPKCLGEIDETLAEMMGYDTY